ncbi:hypothetical protein TWF225_008985 [Orbilia oligospora]|uniref:Uncharacterized protein n=1 Tax=Orbilia oligospora TaxID=2813651 RepID=A0A8H2HYL5_ORBOL|nr:hypothetical protein TWF225_008985 [Orbilia oligospora]KAF3251967.1 hypothetical protein TWF128_006813 [Orbilia oligospora]KAF3264822.1 hypothetical protein TWF217_002998 [Orbilia oligospora]TGJ73382.1 hypothetical protein EYR41_000482 [Orbilia oligospora]
MSCVEAQREVRDDSLQKVNYGAGQFDRSPRYGPYEDVVFDGRDWGANAGLERGTGRVYRRKRGKQDDAKYQLASLMREAHHPIGTPSTSPVYRSAQAISPSLPSPTR